MEVRSLVLCRLEPGAMSGAGRRWGEAVRPGLELPDPPPLSSVSNVTQWLVVCAMFAAVSAGD